MKKIFSFVMIATLAVLLGGCQKYDDSELRNEIEGLKARITAVESLNSYKDLLAKLNSGTVATGYSVNGNEITLTFADGKSLTFNQKGEPGTPGAPGESITGPQGQPGVTPQFRINEETTTWEVSYDEGKTWTDAGSAMDRSLVSDVAVDNDAETLTITLADGSTIVVPFGSGMEAVDLGLSVKWAARNLGAVTPYEYGDYYAWGEIETKPLERYVSDYYKWYDRETKLYTKYVATATYGEVDTYRTLEPEDDVAHVVLGDPWRMPTVKEVQELIKTKDNSNYSWTWKTINGHLGVEIVYKVNGNSIFLPAAGSTVNPQLNIGRLVCFWTSGLCEGESYAAYHTYFLPETTFYLIRNGRSQGQPIRAVKE